MRRRTFFRATGQAIAGVSLFAPARADSAPADSTAKGADFGFASAPVLMNPAPDGVSVVCAVNGPATGWLEFGETDALGQRCDAIAQGLLPYEDKALRFRLTGLKPGKTYFYRVHAVAVKFETAYKVHRGAEVSSETRSFRTLDPEAETASFTVWNDTHQNKDTLRKLIERHRSNASDLLIWNGDITNDVTTEELLISEYLHPAGEAHADSTPVFFSRGNHDVRGQAARLVSQYAPGLGDAYHYVFRQGPIGCVVLDTGEDKPDELPVYAGLNDFAAHRTSQREWLKRAIAEPAFRSAPFRIAVMHIPLWWEGEVPEKWYTVWGGFNGWICEDGRNKWHDLLEEAGVRLVISGHTHKHAWFPPTAAHSYGQITGGGPRPEQATEIRLQADSRQMRVTTANIAGEVLNSLTFEA